jgi:outer membrane protein TolC
MTTKILRFLIITLCISYFISCTKVGPDYVKPDKIQLPNNWEKASFKNDNISDWWALFNDETLNKLIEKASEQNLDLKTAGLRILQARAALGISQGFNYPQQQQISGNLAQQYKEKSDLTNFGVKFDLGWEIDFWGKYARGVESAEATLYSMVASYDNILVSVIAEVARNYINYRTAQERIAYTKRNISIQERVTKMTEVQFNAGNVSELDMQQAKTQLYMTKSKLPALELSMFKARNAISILLGTIPQNIDSILNLEEVKKQINEKETIFSQQSGIKDYNITSLSYIPTADLNDNITISANLLRRRPDIQVAELQAISQNAQIGAAKAELYPHFSLFGTIGFNLMRTSSNNWTSLGDSIGVTIGPSFRWNILQYGRIKNNVRLQDALLQEKLVNYNKKVLTAVNDVENAIAAYKSAKQQLEIQQKVIDASIRSFNLSMTQYKNGFVTYQRLLTSVQNLTLNEDVYAQLKGSISTNLIALYKSLGGGWQINRNKPYLKEKDIKQMRNRTDWADYFDKNKIILPDENKDLINSIIKQNNGEK